MIATKEEQFIKLIAPLNFYMHLSRRAYTKYLANKILLHASTIHAANKKIVELLEGSPALLPDTLFNEAIELLNHYSIWMHQFEEHKTLNTFQLKDIFVFHHMDDQSAFPKQAEQRFFDYYIQLKKELFL